MFNTKQSRMKFNYLWLFLLGIGSLSMAQNLRPNDSYFDLYHFQSDYYNSIKKKLMFNFNQSPLLRVVILPSFELETAFQIEEKDKEYILKLNKPKDQIWKRPPHLANPIMDYNSKIDKQDVELLQKISLMYINNTAYSNKNESGFDGTNYYLSAWENGLKPGQFWSPREGDLATFVGIMEDLAHQVTQNKNKVSLTDENRKWLQNKINETHPISLNAYEIAYKTKECIEEWYAHYVENLSEDLHRNHFSKKTKEFEGEMFELLAEGQLSRESILKLINRYEKELLHFFSNQANNPTLSRGKEIYEASKQDNLFIQLRNLFE